MFHSMRGLRSVPSLVGFAVVTLATVQASAAGAKVAALVPQIRPIAAPELRDRFHEAVARGLTSGGEEVLSAAETRMRLGASEELLGCSGAAACVAHVTQTLKVDQAVASEIDISGKEYSIKLRLVDAAGKELTKADETCDICTVKEADEAVVRTATRLALAAKALPTETPPVATTEPPKAETPPPKVEVTPPPAKVETTVTTPEPTPAPVQPDNNRKMFPWRPLAIASAAVGLVGLAVGIPLLAIDGRPTCDLPNPRTACPNVYNTVGGGATLLTFGILGAAGSGVLFYLDHRARKRAAHPTVALFPIEGGVYVTAGGRF
jgi:hypothetical protein